MNIDIKFLQIFNTKMKSILITTCFLFIIINYYILVPFEQTKFYTKMDYFLLTIDFLAFALLLLCSINKNWIKPTLNVNFVLIWILFVTALLISGYYYRVSLYLLIPFSLIFLIYMFNHNYNNLYKYFCNGIILSFIILTIGSLLFRPLDTHMYYGGRYSGMFTNPNIYGLYLLPVYCVFLIKLHISCQQKFTINNIKFQLLGFSLCSSLIIMTECRTAIISAFLATLLYIFLTSTSTCKKALKIIFYKLFIGSLIITISLPITFYIFRYVPAIVRAPIIYPAEHVYIDSMINSSDQINSEKYAKFNNFLKELLGREDMGNKDINSISTGRIAIYKSYLTKLSLKGHENIGLQIGNRYVAHAHNSYIEVGYKYGIMVGILFIIFCSFSLIQGFKYYFKSNNNELYSLLPLIMTVTFLIASLFEYVSSPFHPLGFSFFIVQAPFFKKYLL